MWNFLSIVLGLDSLEVLETLNVIAHSTSLVSVEENCYRFDHARSRETLYEELSPPLKRGYHGRIAEKLESTKGTALPLSDLAYHFAQAGNREKALKYALLAGQYALERWSNIEAIKHFTYVLKVIGEDPARVEERLGALEGLGDAFYANSMFKESMKTFEELATKAESGVIRLRAFRKAMDSAFHYGDPSLLMELVKKAEPYAAADRLESARVLFSIGRAFMAQGKTSECLEKYKAALQVFEEDYSLWDVAWALIGIGVTGGTLGMPSEAIAAALRSIALFEELGDFRWQMEAYWAAGVTFNECFLEREALDLLAKIIEIDEKMKMGDYIRLFQANINSAISFEQMGDFEEALSYSLKALELSKKTDSLWAYGLVYSHLPVEYARRGDLKNAEEFFEKLLKMPPEILIPIFKGGLLPKAVLSAGKGWWKDSNQYFEKYFEGFKDHPFAAEELVGNMFCAWALEMQGRLEEARIQREKVLKIRREAEERFGHADVQANLMVRRQVVVGEEFEMRLDLVNVARKPTLLVEVENVLTDDFKVTSLPSWCSLQNGGIEMKNREIRPFQVETVKLTLQAGKTGAFTLNPKVVYVDDFGENKTCNLNPITVTVKPAQPTIHVIAGRVSSGFDELDDLLGGGIPENYAVVLASTSSDERELLIKRFLEAGAQAGETVLYIACEAGKTQDLAKQFRNVCILVCNPQADLLVKDLPNVFKLKGVENLTDIDIALVKLFRTLDPAQTVPKRACITLLSDVLLQHHAVIARKWLSSLLANLKARGFTTLAVIDPRMHPPEEAQAVLGLFDGEIRIAEKESEKGQKKVLKVLKLYNQRYLEDELILTKESLLQS